MKATTASGLRSRNTDRSRETRAALQRLHDPQFLFHAVGICAHRPPQIRIAQVQLIEKLIAIDGWPIGQSFEKFQRVPA